MKKRLFGTIAVMMTVVMMLGAVGCGSTETSKENTSTEEGLVIPDGIDELAAKLVTEFYNQATAGKSAMEIAESLGKEDFCGYDCAVSEYPAGYLTGFAEEVTGFKSCVGFMPWIGSIPFVGYIFEIEEGTDGEDFANTLKAIADPMWNLCTTAKDPVTYVCGNYVFITMVPDEE